MTAPSAKKSQEKMPDLTAADMDAAVRTIAVRPLDGHHRGGSVMANSRRSKKRQKAFRAS